eukprot:890580_1
MSKSGKQSMLTIICVQMILCLMCTCNTKTIECPYQGTCSNKQLWCTDNEDCIVNCEQCNNATIYCPRTPHHCNVTCSSNGQRSCEGTTINAIRQNSNGTKLTVIASGHNDIFQNGVVLCPLYNGECTIYCEYDYACRNLEIQAQSTSHTNIRLIATGSGAFYNGNIHGSPYGTLTVHCTGYSACKGPNSIASDPLSLQMDVVASGQIVLEETDVYCPNNGADKSIICNIDVRGLQAMRDGNIYAREAFYDMNLTCDPSLHEGCDAITLFCGDGSYYGTTYSSSCPIELKTSTVSNEWKCVTSQYECQSFSYPPTVAPSVHLTTVAPSYYSTATRETTAVATNATYIGDIDVTVKETNDRDSTEPVKENQFGSIMVGIVIATVILILIAVIIYCKRLQTNKMKIQKDDDKGIDNEEDSKDNKMTEQGMEAAEAKHDEQPSNNPQNMAVMDDIAKNEKEPGQENSNSSGNFDDIFVKVHGEESISKSDDHKALYHGQGTTEGAKDRKESLIFHGTKGDYYDEYHHQIYKERIGNHGGSTDIS